MKDGKTIYERSSPEMACILPEVLMQQEIDYIEIFRGATTHKLDDG